MTKKIPFFLMVAGELFMLLSYAGTVDMLDVDIVVPPNSYTEWRLSPYPGARIQMSAIVTAEFQKSDAVLLEVYVMDEEDRSNYVNENFDDLHIPPAQREFIETYWPASLKFDVPYYFSNWYVVLDNKLRVEFQDQGKEAHIDIDIKMPFRFLLIPGILLLCIGMVILTRRNRPRKETSPK
jgi:hypothetical protein